MTTEFCIARSAPFQRKRLANCNFPRDQWRTCAASSNAASSHTHSLAQYDGGARHMQGTVKFLAIFRAAQAKYPLAQPPPFTSFNFCFHEIFMKLSSPKKKNKRRFFVGKHFIFFEKCPSDQVHLHRIKPQGSVKTLSWDR